MRRTLTLSKETLRILDDEDLARVVGGGDPSDNGGTGQHGSCNGNGNGPSGQHGSCNGTGPDEHDEHNGH
ncbi:hypothetical protein ACU610_25645 [Geodermatophilus sp. URMC 61]|uniref:hypothetical protein n=1 Tax=Geodermatophilus sp. URMC 61 TaxID=3423411 RepID=UPI00406CFC68